MEVYEFNKNLLTRLDESTSVLTWNGEVIPASRVRTEWSYFIEISIEPAGWQALWKIPRVICEELNLRYPTVVFGVVEQVHFKELKAIFIVLAVQDDDVHIPERQEVKLEDLYPTREQENEALNAEKTADCVDRLRFFYNHVWMPWDNENDDDVDWVDKYLESRIRFCYDIKRKDMKRSLAAHIRTLLVEAKYIQQRREYLELGLNEDDDLNETVDKSEITDLMRLHLRLTMIRSEIEILENPAMRKIYEEIKFDDGHSLKKRISEKDQEREAIAYIVTVPCSWSEQMEFLESAKLAINDSEKIVQMGPSLQDVLNSCHSSDEIFLPPGRHCIKFLEYLNEEGTIHGIPLTSKNNGMEAIIMSPDDDSILLVFDGNFTLKNLTLDCSNIRSGILIKNGNVYMEGCKIIGDGRSSTQQGIVMSGSSKLKMIDCVVKDFSIGVSLSEESDVEFKSTIIDNCRIGIEADDKSTILFDGSEICNSKKCGMFCESEMLNNDITQKSFIASNLEDFAKNFSGDLKWTGDCKFDKCTKGNIIIYNQRTSKFPKSLECGFSDNINSVMEDVNGDEDEGMEELKSSSSTNYEDSDIYEIDDSVIEINCDTD